ncbi:MAG: metal-sensitive transcriptional regulator [Gemmatimonadetes bacterium]|nr:metal-sensitive transcriptional regulator [Gemmatimonadota bacterium]
MTSPASPQSIDHEDGSTLSHVGCGCARTAEDGPRKAVAVDADIKARNTRRLRRIEGQVRGLQKMVAEDRYCADILTQIASVQEALRGVSKALMRNHLQHCATDAIRRGPDEAAEMYDELIDLLYRGQR